jgi:membrane-associated phospholipid phosphatase
MSFASRTARAETNADLGRDGAIIAGATTAAVLFNYLPVHEEMPLREHEWLRLDERVRDNFSEGAARASDVSLVLTVGSTSAFAIGTGDGAGDRALVLGESVAIALAATSVAKVIVARPRPYVYNDDERALRRRDRAGRDAYRSWFSGHAAMSFAAVAASGALFAENADHSPRERALVWGMGLTLATATSNLRVRAGRHFYSDVAIGAVVGGTIGTVVPALHSGELVAPSGIEIAAMGGGLVLGAVASQLLPVGSSSAHPVRVSPLLMRDGAGIAFGGRL